MVRLSFFKVLFFILFFQFVIYADGLTVPQIKATISKNEITIGEPLEYKLSIASKDKNYKIVLPKEKVFIPKVNKPEDKKSDIEKKSEKLPLYIIESANRDDNSTENLLYQTITLKMVYYRVGKFSLPEIEIYDNINNLIGYKIPEITVKSLNQNGAFGDIEPPLELGGNHNRLILLIIGSILLGIIITLITFYIRKIIKASKEYKVFVPPIIVFTDEMKKLMDLKLLENEKIEKFVLELSHIFRKFLSSFMKFDALEMTDDEILKIFKDKYKGQKLKEFYGELNDIVSFWNLTKFAEFTPSKDILEQNYNNCKSFAEKIWKEEDSNVNV